MYVCMYVYECVYVCMYLRTYIHTYVGMYVCVYVCMYVCVCVVCMYVCVCVICMYVCVCVCVCVYVCVCMYVCTPCNSQYIAFIAAHNIHSWSVSFCLMWATNGIFLNSAHTHFLSSRDNPQSIFRTLYSLHSAAGIFLCYQATHFKRHDHSQTQDAQVFLLAVLRRVRPL